MSFTAQSQPGCSLTEVARELCVQRALDELVLVRRARELPQTEARRYRVGVPATIAGCRTPTRARGPARRGRYGRRAGRARRRRPPTAGTWCPTRPCTRKPSTACSSGIDPVDVGDEPIGRLRRPRRDQDVAGRPAGERARAGESRRRGEDAVRTRRRRGCRACRSGRDPRPSSGWEKPGMSGGPFTPARWAETPTHAFPLRMISAEAWAQTGSRSMPPLTFNHSSTTVPSKRRRVDGSSHEQARREARRCRSEWWTSCPSSPSAVPGAGPYVGCLAAEEPLLFDVAVRGEIEDRGGERSSVVAGGNLVRELEVGHDDQ